MTYREIKPTGFLNHFIQSFWEYKTAEAALEHTIIPDGYFDLIAEFEDGSLKLVKLTGVWTCPIQVSIPKATTIFAVRFKLLAAEYLFQQEIKSILNTSGDLPLSFWNINNYQTDGFEKFVSDVSAHLENAISHLKEIDNRKLKLFELIYGNQNLSVTGLSENIHWSRRQINRYFNQQFGFSLKTFLNIVRCNSSYEHISEGNLSPTDDYFDQAHFIKEIKKHTGTTPGELFKNENDRFLQLSSKS